MEKMFEFWNWNSLFYQGMIPKTLGVHDFLKCQPPNSKIQTLCKSLKNIILTICQIINWSWLGVTLIIGFFASFKWKYFMLHFFFKMWPHFLIIYIFLKAIPRVYKKAQVGRGLTRQDLIKIFETPWNFHLGPLGVLPI
jgi:hypothetical protein